MKQTSAVNIGSRSAGHDNNFNLIRMLAATGVLISHAYPLSLGHGTVEPLQPFLKGLSLGGLSVLVFFSISGFFITRSFAGKSSLSSFFIARALRLFPALVVVLAVTVIVAAALTTASMAVYWGAVPDYYLRSLTMFFIKHELPGVFETNPYGGAINGSLWTLKYEVLCYMGVVICGLLGILGRSTLFGLWLAGFGLAYGVTMVVDVHPLIAGFMSLGLPFAIGMSFWVYRDRIPLSPNLVVLVGLVAALSWLTPIFIPVFTLAVCYTVFVLGYARFSLLAFYKGLGDYSYGMYVYAFPIQQFVAWSGVESPLWNMAISLPLTLLCAVLSWHLVEAQALKWKRRPVSSYPPEQRPA